MSSFTKATKTKSKLRLCFTGTAGSGKTFSALQVAKGMGGKIVLIDTEHGSGALYSDLCDYDTCTIESPFKPEKVIELIKEAENLYDTIILDSLTHFWAGEGGLLERHDNLTVKTGNSYTAWSTVTPVHTSMIEAILQSKSHIISTLRSKMDYVIEKNEKGKAVPRKVGLAPVMREGMDYEFTVVMDMDISHHATVSKDRTRLFDSNIPFTPTVETGKLLFNWVNSGTEPQTETESKTKTKPEFTFESAKARMIELGNLPAVRGWWVKYAPMIAMLTKEQQKELQEIGEGFKDDFKKSKDDSWENKAEIKPPVNYSHDSTNINSFINETRLVHEFIAYCERKYGMSPDMLDSNQDAVAEVVSWVNDYKSLLAEKKMTMADVIEDLKMVLAE